MNGRSVPAIDGRESEPPAQQLSQRPHPQRLHIAVGEVPRHRAIRVDLPLHVALAPIRRNRHEFFAPARTVR
ncbi:MAG: hypothetical protein VCE43_07970, partial [Myxococcota bacterium]